MATTYPTPARTAPDDEFDPRAVLLLVAYAGLIVAVVAAATGAAFVLAGATAGLGQFVLLAAAWLAVVSASPELARRGTIRLAALELGGRAPRSARAVDAVVTYVLAR